MRSTDFESHADACHALYGDGSEEGESETEP